MECEEAVQRLQAQPRENVSDAALTKAAAAAEAMLIRQSGASDATTDQMQADAPGIVQYLKVRCCSVRAIQVPEPAYC